MAGKAGREKAAKSIFEDSIVLLANVLAFAAALLGTGPVYSWSIGWVYNFSVTQYGSGLAGLIEFVWIAVVALTLFAFARATLTTSLVMGGLALAARIFA
ncbi:hypothetical protein [Henriciella algicola]|uniref:Uncharacterized protein n=1 Tax=Henriciella algicola TaxID=1608422 RepID=A0A399RHH0_9PROT|nr:hypothetical protein [Henriciella algicola]RIJ31056.1 hypothetical protein D1222_01955 [Henriciella algicola]